MEGELMKWFNLTEMWEAVLLNVLIDGVDIFFN
jgi:hypothetical protein